MRKIVCTANAFDFDTRRITQISHTHQHRVVFLKIVTYARHVRNHLLAEWQSHQHTFTIARIGFTRFFDQRANHNAFRKWLTVQYWPLRAYLVNRSLFVQSIQWYVAGDIMDGAHGWKVNIENIRKLAWESGFFSTRIHRRMQELHPISHSWTMQCVSCAITIGMSWESFAM